MSGGPAPPLMILLFTTQGKRLICRVVVQFGRRNPRVKGKPGWGRLGGYFRFGFFASSLAASFDGFGGFGLQFSQTNVVRMVPRWPGLTKQISWRPHRHFRITSMPAILRATARKRPASCPAGPIGRPALRPCGLSQLTDLRGGRQQDAPRPCGGIHLGRFIKNCQLVGSEQDS